MRILFKLLFILALLTPLSLKAQSTTLSGTVTDTNGQVWANGTYTFVFVPANNITPPVWTGGAFNPLQQIQGTLNGSGAYSQTLPSNNAITPVNSSWSMTVCSGTVGPVCQTFTQIILTSGTQTFNPAPSPPVIAPGANQTVYNTSEVGQATVGSQIYVIGTGLQTCSSVSFGFCTLWVTSAGTALSGNVGQVAAFNGANSVTSVPLFVAVDAVQSAGIGAAQVAWAPNTAYPLCQSVSNSGNYIAVSASNIGITPGTNSHIWWPIPNGSRTTQVDCSYYIAQSQVTSNGAPDILLGVGNYNSCIAFTSPTVPSPGYPMVGIVGMGPNDSIITQTCPKLAGLGGDGLAMLNIPPASVGFSLPRGHFRNFQLNANALAVPFDLHACQQSSVENVDIENPPAGTDHGMEIGTVGGGSTGWCYELAMTNVSMGYNPNVTGFGHGNGAAAASVTVSGGVPTITVTNGGSSYNASQLSIRLVKAGGLEACSSPGVNTPTVVSGVITAISSTATGCAATGSTFVQFYSQLQVSYGFKFSNMSDSHKIDSLVPGGVGSIAGIYISNVGNMNKFHGLHPISTFNGVQDFGTGNYEFTQIDSVANWGFDFEGQNTITNLYGTMFEWNNTHYEGSSDYHFGTTTNPPTGSPSAINIFGDVCGNRAQQDAYGHLVVPLGVVDISSNALPTFVNIFQTQYCDQKSTNSVEPHDIANPLIWSNGTRANYWSWGFGNGFSATLTLANYGGTNTNPWTWYLQNSNAATGGANQNSPKFGAQANYWDGSVSQPYGWQIQTTCASGTGPFCTFALSKVGTEPSGGHGWTVDAGLGLKTYTVSTLPSASSLPSGTTVIVTDATTFTVGTCTGGGSDTMLAVTNGSSWSCH